MTRNKITKVRIASKNTPDWYIVKFENGCEIYITCHTTKEARKIAIESNVYKALSDIPPRKFSGVPSTEGETYRYKAMLTTFKTILNQVAYKGYATVDEAIALVNEAYKTGNLTQLMLISDDPIIIDMVKELRRLIVG